MPEWNQMKARRLIQVAVLLAFTTFLNYRYAQAQNPGPPASVTNTILPTGSAPNPGQAAPDVERPPTSHPVPNKAAPPGKVNPPNVIQSSGVGGFYQRGTNFFYPTGTNGFFRRGVQGEQKKYYPDNEGVYRRGPGGAYLPQDLRRRDDNSSRTNYSAMGTNGSSPYHMR